MRDLRLNLIDGLSKEEKTKLEGSIERISFLKRNKKNILRTVGIFVVVSIFLFSRGLVTEQSLIQEMPKISFWKGMARMLIFQEHLLKGEISDRINILLLGMGGAEHEGPYLTDTIILASLRPSTNELALISFPRDLWVPIPGYGWGKINSANALGQANEGNGVKLATSVVESITNLPIHYFVRLDFAGFKEIIDAIDGIEIEVERSFVDSMYPGPNFTFRTISFERGWQKMDGARALEYVRSRHGTNNEDSDFARSRRQQKVIFAIKEKLEQIKIFENPQKAWTLFNLINKYFDTNLSFDELINLSQKLKGITPEKIINQTFDLSENSPIYSDIYNGAYVLKTRTGDFKEIADIAKNVFNQEKKDASRFKKKRANLVILNGTHIQGLARAKSELLISKFNILEVGNAEERDYQENVIYDLTRGKKKLALDELKKLIGGVVFEGAPSNLSNYQTDFIIILGAK